MLRLRISSERGQEPSVSIAGRKKILYSNVVYKPQLYRLVDKFGKVINENIFTRQKKI